jgi:hypothetical protein
LTANQQAQARANIDVLKKNYILNGAMMVSQENGTTTQSAAGKYPVDQFRVDFAHAGVMSFAQEPNPSPAGSPYQLVVAAGTADTVVGTSDYIIINHAIEGFRVADLKFGTAAAKTITIQFGVNAPTGTYCLAVSTIDASRTYVAEYFISAGENNTPVVKSVVIPGDITGTWAKDNTAGMVLRWCLMAGASFQAAANSWTSGNFLGTANQINWIGAAPRYFRLFDVGLYEGNVAPPFQVPDYASELALCKRYFQKIDCSGNSVVAIGQAITGTRALIPIAFPGGALRATPTLTASGTFAVWSAAATPLGLSGYSVNNTSSHAINLDVNVASGLVAGNATTLVGQTTGIFYFNARL